MVMLVINKRKSTGLREIEPQNPRERKLSTASADTPRGIPTGSTLRDSEPSLALQALLEEMHSKSENWTKGKIAALETKGELEKVRSLEAAHPRFKGGRSNVFRALQRRAIELDSPAPTPPAAPPAPKVAAQRKSRTPPPQPVEEDPDADLDEAERLQKDMHMKEDELARMLAEEGGAPAGDPPAVPPAPEADASADPLKCPETGCEFKAGSPIGLKAHLAAKHAGE